MTTTHNLYTPPKVWANNDNQQTTAFSGNSDTAGARFTQSLPKGNQPLQLYSLNTPNGIKVNIMLQELAMLGITDAGFDAFEINILEGQQFGSDFVKLNPNSKIPVLLDQTDDENIAIFESGAILLYLAEKFQQFFPFKNMKQKTSAMSWLMWQMGSAPYVGGGFGHFYHYAPTKLEYPINRFTMETKRQLDVLNQHLATHEYITDYGYSIVDMAIFPWYGLLVTDNKYNAAEFLSVHQYQHVIRWAKLLHNRRAITKALNMPLQKLNP